ncbi:MAG: hypothetical protein QXO72_01255 [Sulfolobales archaeon]
MNILSGAKVTIFALIPWAPNSSPILIDAVILAPVDGPPNIPSYLTTLDKVLIASSYETSRI